MTDETESRRRWVSQNVKLLRQAAQRMAAGGATEAAFAPKGNLQLIPNSYQMSRGGLSIASFLVPKTTAADGKSFGAKNFAPIGEIVTVPEGEYTGLDLWRLVFGLLPGDQLTFPQIYGDGLAQEMYGGNGVIDSTRYTDFCAPRIVLINEWPSTEAKITLDENVTTQQIASQMLKAVNTDSTWYDMEQLLTTYLISAYDASGVTIGLDDTYSNIFAINNDDWLRAIGCIRSHKNAETGKWEYSTSYMVCVWADGDRGSDSDYFGFTLQNAIETYLNTYVTDAEGNFLQRGGDSDIVPESFT